MNLTADAGQRYGCSQLQTASEEPLKRQTEFRRAAVQGCWWKEEDDELA
jgi:hypothetical protein